jgi:lipopolysaccharide export system permease protein
VGGCGASPETSIRLQRYILRELLAAFALILAIVTAIVGAGLLLQFLHKAPQLGLMALVKGLPYVLPEAFPITLPLSFLVACLLTYGRFADDNEFTAFRMGGLHPWRAIAPAVALGAVLSIFTVWLNTDALPWAVLGKREILRDQLAQLIRAIEEGNTTTVNPSKGFHLSSASRASDGAFVDAHISIAPRRKKGGTPQPTTAGADLSKGGEIRAERAWLFYDEAGDALVLRLQDALWVQDDVTIEVAENTIAVALDSLLDASPREEAKKTAHMSASELSYRIARGSPDEERLRGWQAELWNRIGMGLAPLVFGLLGAPLGLWSAKGSRATAFLLSLLIAMPVYYPLMRVGENLAVEGTLPAPVALLGADIVLAATGLWFLGKVVRT